MAQIRKVSSFYIFCCSGLLVLLAGCGAKSPRPQTHVLRIDPIESGIKTPLLSTWKHSELSHVYTWKADRFFFVGNENLNEAEETRLLQWIDTDGRILFASFQGDFQSENDPTWDFDHYLTHDIDQYDLPPQKRELNLSMTQSVNAFLGREIVEDVYIDWREVGSLTLY